MRDGWTRGWRWKLAVAILAAAGVAAEISIRKGSPHGAPFWLRPDVAGVRSGATHVYLVHAPRREILFDAGGEKDGAGLLALLAMLHSSAPEVSDVYLTRTGDDVSGALPILKNARVHGARAANGVTSVTDGLTGEFSHPIANWLSVRGWPAQEPTDGTYLYFLDGVLVVGDWLDLAGGQLVWGGRGARADRERRRSFVARLRRILGTETVDIVATSRGGPTNMGAARKLLDEFFAAYR